MNEEKTLLTEPKQKTIDPVYIINQYVVISTIENDVIFAGKASIEPIFTGGIIKDLTKNVYNLVKGQLVGYISYEKTEYLEISSNLVFNFQRNDPYLLFILPYASYALKILRETNTAIGRKILIIGFNFFSILFSKLIRLTGAEVFIIKLNEEIINYEKEEDIEENLIQLKDNDITLILNTNFSDIFVISKDYERIFNIITDNKEKIHCEEIKFIGNHNFKDDLNLNEFNIVKINRFDRGYLDKNYIKGVRYPYSYLRWDYRKNLEYFISLVENDIINLTFLKINLINLESFNEIQTFIDNKKGIGLTLLKISLIMNYLS